jgi:glutamine amidotransferase
VTRIAILDYGMGNLRSVEKALERIGSEAVISSEGDEVRDCDGVVLPGVGAFPKAMARVRELKLDELLVERVDAGVPVLGICLGMQLLFERSVEHGGAEGLGLAPGPVELLDAPDLKVPHIGWSAVRWEKDSALREGLGAEVPFYFVHSYTPVPADPDDVLATTAYGQRYSCAVERGALYGVQFHPEKSSTAGLKLLANFASICAKAPTTA